MPDFPLLRRCRPLHRSSVAVVLAAAVLSTAAGCTSDDDPAAAPAPATPVTISSMAELADRLGCTGLAPATEVDGPTVQEQGTCRFDDDTATLHVFATPEGLTTWTEQVRGPGVTAVLLGSTWAVSFDDRAAGEAARQRLGGRLV